MMDEWGRLSTRFRYRGCSIYAKYSKRGTRVSGEILIGKSRQWVPQQETVKAMLSVAERMIDRALAPEPCAIDKWFRQKLV